MPEARSSIRRRGATLRVSMTDEKRSRAWLWIVIGGGAFFLFVLAVFSLVYVVLHGGRDSSGLGGFGDKIAVVDLDGVIMNPGPTVQQLKKFADDDSVKAIILHVNSPGGGVAASEEIYREVKRIRDEKKKRIVASIETVGASGAYYVSSATNKIYADKGSVVGSIGVIAEWVNYGDLLQWAKLKSVILKTGEFKDTGTPTRELTPAEKAYLQGLIDNMFHQFIQAVADGRAMKFDDVKAIADGRVWTGEQAMSLKLVDQLGDFQSAVEDTAKSVNIKGEPTLVRPEKDRKSLLDLMFGDVSEYLPTREKIMDEHVSFYYMWK
jgi:protease-4